MNVGEIREGDIFQKDHTFILVQRFVDEGKDRFAQVELFNSEGLLRKDCLNVLRLYKMRFLKNISEIV